MKTRRKTTGVGRRGGGGGSGENLARDREREREQNKTKNHGAPENSPIAVAHFKQHTHTHTHTAQGDSCTPLKKVRRKTRQKTKKQQEGRKQSYDRARSVRVVRHRHIQHNGAAVALFTKPFAAASQKLAHALTHNYSYHTHREQTRDPGTDCCSQCVWYI